MCEQSCVPSVGECCSHAASTIVRPSFADNKRESEGVSRREAAVCAFADATREHPTHAKTATIARTHLPPQPVLPMALPIDHPSPVLVQRYLPLFYRIPFGLGLGNGTCPECNRPN